MNRDQLSNFNPNNPFANSPSELHSHFDNEAIFVQPVAPAAKSSVRQQVLDRILDKICEQNLLGKSYVEQYLRHKYRRNCKANTLKIAATSRGLRGRYAGPGAEADNGVHPAAQCLWVFALFNTGIQSGQLGVDGAQNQIAASRSASPGH